MQSRMRDSLCLRVRGKVKAFMKKVNEVSRLAGVSKRTLQFYDDEGLLPAKRSKDNYRLYDDSTLECLWQILVYREMGLDLKEIKHMLSVSEKEKTKYLDQKIKDIQQRVAYLNEQMAFMTYVQQHGMLPVPSEESVEERTYVECISALKKMRMIKKEED